MSFACSYSVITTSLKTLISGRKWMRYQRFKKRATERAEQIKEH